MHSDLETKSWLNFALIVTWIIQQGHNFVVSHQLMIVGVQYSDLDQFVIF